MNLLRCATHTVTDVDKATSRYADWLDYRVLEQGTVPLDLAQTWAAPASADRRYAVIGPASGAPVYLRFIEGDPVPDYQPIRSYGWAAAEICVQDVLAVNERMLQAGSPFLVIGPPTKIAGLDTIFPMQVRGPDLETLYFTEITTKDTIHGLPTARSPIDTLFILVLACPDMRATADWFARTLGVAVTEPMAIRYSMISKAFALPIDDLHEIVTAAWKGDIFLEFDQYPEQAVTRASHHDALPPGVSVCSLNYPSLDGIDAVWLSHPTPRGGVIYDGRRSGVLKTPEGALLELIEM